MTRTTFRHLAGAAALLLCPALAAAGDITIEDPYFRTAGAMARSGAAFMTIRNAGASDDRLIAARSDLGDRVELHTHIDAGNGVMQMREDEDGFEIPAGGLHELARGGDHVMFMGLTRTVETGDTVTLTLIFEKAGEMDIEVPVDLERMPRGGMMHGGGSGG